MTAPVSSPPALALAGGWARKTLAFERQSLYLWCPADTDAVLEHQVNSGNDDDPFWCYLWPTAHTLARHVLEINHPLPQRVLETGCGIGLVGLAALATGAPTVTFQDLRSTAVELALHNAKENGFADRAAGDAADWRYVPCAGKPTPLSRQFDWILASDILYDQSLHQPLLDFLERTIVTSPAEPNGLNGSIWIGDPGRNEAEAFLERAESRFHLELFDAEGNRIPYPVRRQYQRIVLRLRK